MANWKETCAALRQRMAGIALGLTGYVFSISDIPSCHSLAYTMESEGSVRKIYIAFNHPMVQELKKTADKVAFVLGLFAHELMHQLETDFDADREIMKKIPTYQQEIYHSIFNVMEDPAIEYHAPQYFGGLLIKTLRFMISRVYMSLPKIDPESSPMSQFMSAAVQYANGGVIKGKVTDKEAQECLIKAFPLFDECILEPNGARRAELAYEVFELTRPLWKDEAKNQKAMESLIKSIKAMLAENGIGMEDTDGSPCGRKIPVDPEDVDDATKAMAERRDSTKQEFAYHARDGAKPAAGKDEKPEEEGEARTEQDDSDGDGAIDSCEYELTEEDYAAIDEEVQSCLESERIEEGKEQDDGDIDFEVSDMQALYPGKSCLNLRITENGLSEEAYNNILESISVGINRLTRQLKRIFLEDVEEKAYKQSGRVDIKRWQSTRKTSRIFTRRVEPTNKADVAVMIAVDTSGSMHGMKEHMAKLACIGLAEVFNNLNVPFKVMSFSADQYINGRSYDALHTHYVNFSKSKKERMKLMNIAAYGNNFDGYSISYAAKLLSKRREQHKLLIVISDGAPACSAYHGHQGIIDTKMAVRNAKKKATVIGVAIDANVDIISGFYGPTFVKISEINELFDRLGNTIKKEIRNW